MNLRLAEYSLGLRVARALPGGALIPAAGDAAWGAFDAMVRRLSLLGGRITAVAGLLVCVVTWPTDFLFLTPGERHVFVIWRSGVVVLVLALLAVLAAVPAARRHVRPFGGTVLAGCALWMSFHVGLLGGLRTPWPYWLVLLPLMTMVFPAQVQHRLMLVAAVTAAVLVGYLAPQPDRVLDPYFPQLILMLIVACILGFGSGEVTTAFLMLHFFQQRETERTAGELADLNERLDVRVREQTADLRALGEHLLEVQERERTRLAQELHDELGQQLSGARFSLAAARAKERQGGAPRESLAESERMLASAADTTRRIVNGLRPLVLEQLGLSAACEWLVRTTCTRADLAWELDASGSDVGLTHEQALAAYRVLQEALTNIVKHAGAATVHVTLERPDGGLVLTVHDDGRGLDGDGARTPGSGMGLIGMRERALANGGDLSIESGQGRGTEIVMRLPKREGEA